MTYFVHINLHLTADEAIGCSVQGYLPSYKVRVGMGYFFTQYPPPPTQIAERVVIS